MKIGRTFWFLLFFGAMAAYQELHAQPKLDFELKKPKEFEERQLGSEKSADKKFTVVRRFFQNTYTHYNYFFNANNMVNDIMAGAAIATTDDYTELLPYYAWTLEQTSQSRDIDSILKTVTAGILLHDLRNDWIDNMYLLMGKAYYLRKDFDSASMAFQYLNYSFADRDKDGNRIPIGSNSEEGNNAFAIMTEERKNYLIKRPPSRNDGFVWQIRNLTDKGNFLDASSLIAIIRNDPNFPKRLDPNLSEVTGYLFYKLAMWDSAAHYLELAMPNASNPSDRARRWYLTGQLYQLGNNHEKAANAYSKCLGLATDLVMDLYARLNSIRLRKDDNPAYIEQNVKDLLAMARRDKYAEYRDIIYYATALVELERNGYEAADAYLLKSLQNNTNNAKQKSMSFLALGDLRFDQKKYGPAGPPYDSIELNHLKEHEAERTKERKPPTFTIYQAEKLIAVQDSLIALAELPEDERIKIVRKLSNQLRRRMGLKEEIVDMGVDMPSRKGVGVVPADLFSSSAGSWYFYDASIRANGFNAFKERWGARPNEDNWRRSSALMMANSGFPKVTEESSDPDGFSETVISKLSDDFYDSTDVSFDNLYSRIPLTPERLLKTEENIIDALFSKAKALHEQIEDYPEAVKVYEEILSRRDTGALAEKTLFALIHCYTKMGETAKAQQARQKLEKKNPEMVQAKENKHSRQLLDETYENIYGLFLEGNFQKALEEKRKADSLLGNSYWKPQLLYIQSVYHIKQREDSLAIKELNNIVSTFPDHKLSPKSKRIIDVLKRRSEIEEYLTNLQITRAEEDSFTPVVTRPIAPELPKVEQRSAEDSARITEATLLAQKEAEEAAKAEADRLAKEKMDQKAREEAEADRLAKAEADRLAIEEADRLAKAEADKLAIEEADRLAKAEADKLAREEAERKAKAEAERLEKEEADRLERERLAREEEAKKAAEKAEAERIAAAKALAEKQAAEKLKAEQELAEKIAAEKEKAEKELAEKQAAEKAKAEKELAEKQAREKEALEKDAANKAEAEKALAEKQALEKAALEKEMAEKLAAEKALVEKEQAEKEAAEKAASAKLLAEKQAAEKAEAERLAKEKAEKENAERLEAEKMAADKAEADRMARELARKEAADKAEAERLAQEKADKEAAELANAARLAKEKAEKEASDKAEAERLAKAKAEKEAAEKIEAERQAKEKEAAEKAALAKANMVDNVVVGQPTTPSPYKINANEKQVVAIVLERIDPAYVNEVAYSLTHSSLKNIDKNEVEVIKKRIKENLWFVELRSDGFKNMQAAYEYIKYIKPITRDEVVTWLDDSKYYFITIGEANLKEIEKSGDVKLYQKVLNEAVPGKF